ncbi:MAG: bifunctional adenosylcobinamide kinase/adenosylcobinamide-phosphate guanylyltransferase [Planctomycetota bacterium]|nr:bifunctional adenosylcobinamide kinase/adenosylcobinamide-phosphate guanylyltransferase [Planctomycetota bacterium]
MPVTLILGGARSGKSRRAEELARGYPGRVVYVATGPELADDEEWSERIAAHRLRRPAGWTTREAPLELVDVLAAEAGPEALVLVDCLTLWLSNWLQAGRAAAAAVEVLASELTRAEGQLVLVSNEVGSGIVPATPLGRQFRDGHGALNQAVAAIAERVELMVAGIPVVVKDG